MSERIRNSWAGVASLVLGLAMVVIELGTFALTALGVSSSEGPVQVFYVPFFLMVTAGWPCVLLALVGLVQRRRKRTFAAIGLGLALLAALPVIFMILGPSQRS